jgi:hypothetical protein
MSLEELGGMLRELEETRKLAETELENLAAPQEPGGRVGARPG